MYGFSITQEALLATEELVKDKMKAEASTPQAFEAFNEKTEQEAIKEREDNSEQEAEDTGSEAPEDQADTEETPEDQADSGETPEGEAVPEDEDKQEDQDSDTEQDDDIALKDSIEPPEKPSNESLSEWIKDKTAHSDSAIVRNAGELAAGLAHLGVTYGPSILNYMFKGMLWTFSRLGTVLYDSHKMLSDYIERSQNSISKLEARLSAAETSLSKAMNTGAQIPAFTFKNQKVISFLKIGNSVEFTANIRGFATSLSNAGNGIAAEFASGISTVEKIVNSGSQSKLSDLKTLMQVSPPRSGFRPGNLPGYEPRSDLITNYHTDPLWPGDASLIFSCPNINSNEITEISKAYGQADMFIGINRQTGKTIERVKSLNGPEIAVMAKSVRILLASMKELNKIQENMKNTSPKLSLKAKQLFIDLADDKAKVAMKDTLVEPMYLRATLSSAVFASGSTSMMTHASRVASSAIAFIEAHSQKIATSTEPSS